MKKLLRKTFSRLMVCVLAATFLVGICYAANPSPVYAPPSDPSTPADVYLVLDNSKSMRDTDPDQLLDEFAKKFFTRVDVGNSTIGVITYAREVKNIRQSIPCSGNADDLGDLGYTQGDKGTNIGKALKRAADELNGSYGSMGKNPNKAIILVTDGDPDETSEYYEAQSCNGTVIPVYCISINEDASSNQSACKNYLNDIASRTGTNSIYELEDIQGIETIIDDLMLKVFNLQTTPHTFQVKDTIDVPCKVDPNIYDLICTIKYTDKLVLTITDPSGKKIYDNNTSFNPHLNVSNQGSPAVVNLLWPQAGDYIFTLSVEEEQTVNFDMIEISAGMSLDLSNSTPKKGESVEATTSITGNTGATLANLELVMFDSADQEVTADFITKTGDTTFSINTKELDIGSDYSIVALADMSDNSRLASVKVPLHIKDPENCILKFLKEHLGLVIGLIIALLILLVLFILYQISLSKPCYCHPQRGMLLVRILQQNPNDHSFSQINMVTLPLPQALPSGKPLVLGEMVAKQQSYQAAAVNAPIPPELNEITLSCWKSKKSAPNSEQYFNVVLGKGKAAQTMRLSKTNGTKDFSQTFPSGIRVEIRI